MSTISHFFGNIFNSAIPVILLAALLFLLLSNKDGKTFKSKIAYFPMATFFTLACLRIQSLFISFSGFSLLLTLLFSAGCFLLFLSCLNEKYSKLSIPGFALLIADALLSPLFIHRSLNVFNIAAYVLLLLLAMNKGGKFIRTAAVILLLLSITVAYSYDIILILALIVYSFLLVPGKFKINFSIAVAILYAVIAALFITAIPSYLRDTLVDYAGVIGALLGAVGSILLTIYFFKKNSSKLPFIGYGLVAIAFSISFFGEAGFGTIFNAANPISAFYILITALFLIIVKKNNPEKSEKLRIAVIVLSAIALLFSYSILIDFPEELSVCEIVFAFNSILASIILVPFTFKKYQGIGKYIFLTIITLGIWNLIWQFHVTKNLNEDVEGTKKRNPAKELLLYMFLPLYSAYWTHKTALLMEKYATNNGKKATSPILILALCFVSPFFSAILIQDKINEIIEITPSVAEVAESVIPEAEEAPAEVAESDAE